MKKIFLSIILVLLPGTQAFAESSLWKVEKGGNVMFLGGTIHLLRQSDFPLPVEFEKAYTASDLLVFETDPGKLNDPSTQQKLMLEAMYTDGSTIDSHLSAQTYQLLNEYCASSGIPLSKFQKFKPSIIALTITVIELSRLGVGQEGVDMFFYKLARRDNKVVEGFETIGQQIHLMVGMGEGNEDEFITYSIKDLESIKQKYGAIVDAWKSGDAKELNNQINAELKIKMPNLYRKLLTERNKNWLPMIEAYHKTPEKEFILVGAAHLVGEDGIVEALRQKGYKVEKL